MLLHGWAPPTIGQIHRSADCWSSPLSNGWFSQLQQLCFRVMICYMILLRWFHRTCARKTTTLLHSILHFGNNGCAGIESTKFVSSGSGRGHRCLSFFIISCCIFLVFFFSVINNDCILGFHIHCVDNNHDNNSVMYRRSSCFGIYKKRGLTRIYHGSTGFVVCQMVDWRDSDTFCFMAP